jgi:DNA repair exonuclease SbcCD ATPase subunit
MGRTFLVCLFALSASAMAFGVPESPDVPDVDVPEIEIPGMEMLDEVEAKLDELITETDALRLLIPELSTLDDVSAKLDELRETDPELEDLQAELDALRDDLVDAKTELDETIGSINAEIEDIHSLVETFTEGLPTAEND